MMEIFSRGIRRYIPVGRYAELMATVGAASLISTQSPGSAEVEARRVELLGYEQERGFVYIGERQWLESEFASYPDWANAALNNSLFSTGWSVEESTLGNVWEAYCEDLRSLVTFPELTSESLGMEWITLKVSGSEAGPRADLMALAFGILHDIAYVRWEGWSPGREDFRISEIEVETDGKWFVDMQNDYGSAGHLTFLGSLWEHRALADAGAFRPAN